MLKGTTTALIFIVACSYPTRPATADVYVYKDKNGVLTFSAVPKAGYRKVSSESAATETIKGESTEGRPDLSTIPADEAKAIENACSGARRLSGPARYYECLQRELTALGRSPGRPDLSTIPENEAKAIENACSGARRLSGPARYYECLQRELTALGKSPGRPDLSTIPENEAKAIENACSGARRLSGPARYYECLQRELAELKRFLGQYDNRARTNVDTKRENGSPPIEEITAAPHTQKQNDIVLPNQSSFKPKKTLQPVPLAQLSGARSLTLPTSIANQGIEKRDSRISSADILTIGIGIFILSAFVLIIRDKWLGRRTSPSISFRLGRTIYQHVLPRRCRQCSARTPNISQICNNCQTISDNENLKAQESERQKREAQARAQERDRQEREARARAEEAKRREDARAQDEARRRAEEEKRKRTTTLDDLQRLTGNEFEAFVATLFQKDGYTVIRRGGTGDEGIDLILHLGTEKDVVQCKRWKNDIGSPVVREFYGSMMHIGARHGFIITTASFSESAKGFGVGKPIVLIDGQYLLSWINGTKSSRRDSGEHNARKSGFDPYDVLGVTKGASKEEIKTAYFTIVKKYHPDMVSHLGQEFQKIAEEKTREINRAYEILTAR